MGKFPLTEIKSFVSRYFCNLGGGRRKGKKKNCGNGGINFAVFSNDSYLASSFIYYGISRTTNAISIIA